MHGVNTFYTIITHLFIFANEEKDEVIDSAFQAIQMKMLFGWKNLSLHHFLPLLTFLLLLLPAL